MPAESLLSRLDKVKRTGTSQWIARCPAHEDRSPSLSVREMEDGHVLVHCFADCSVKKVLSAVGLTFNALFPEKPQQHARPLRRPFPAADVLECLATETLIVQICAGDLASGKPLSTEALARLRLASERIAAGRSLANG